MKVGYARVSTREQSENSHALEQQCDRLTRAGAEKLYIDIDSGSKDNRPQFNNMMEAVSRGQIQKIIVTRLDRLTRSLPTLRKTISDLKKYQCQLSALDDSVDTDTAAGRFQINMLGALAEMETDRLSERVRHGYKHLRNNKMPIRIPFGYTKKKNQYSLDTEAFLCLIESKREMSKAEIGRDMIETFLVVKTLRMTIKLINSKYGIQKFKARRTSPRVFSFSHNGLKYWLNNVTLRGHTYYPSEKTIFYDTHPEECLMSESEYKEITAIFQHNKKHHGFRPQQAIAKYPCSGLVFCDKCGSSMGSHYVDRNKIVRYKCRYSIIKSCSNTQMVGSDKLEAAIAEKLSSRAIEIANIANSSSNSTEKSSPELQRLNQQLFSLKQIPGASSNPAIQEAITQVQNQIGALRHTLLKTEQRNASLESLLQAFSDPEFYLSITEQDRRRLFHELVEKVSVNHGEIIKVRLKI
jgi:DNA invertase Pin-like site-specific DNA recombinase